MPLIPDPPMPIKWMCWIFLNISGPRSDGDLENGAVLAFRGVEDFKPAFVRPCRFSRNGARMGAERLPLQRRKRRRPSFEPTERHAHPVHGERHVRYVVHAPQLVLQREME